jgi:hypothetical protein
MVYIDIDISTNLSLIKLKRCEIWNFHGYKVNESECQSSIQILASISMHFIKLRHPDLSQHDI